MLNFYRSNLTAAGFTLLEVLIAVMIVGFISLFTTMSIRRGVQFKSKIQSTLDQRTALNNAMKIIERDINLAFHYQDYNYELETEIEKSQYDDQKKKAEEDAKKSGAAVNIPPFLSKLKPLKKLTHFLGEEDKINFTNINHVRTSANVKESDQQEVGYFTKNCNSIMRPELKGLCVWRRTSPIIDEDVSEGGDEMVLIEGVKSFKLRYFGKGKEDWYKEWKTDNRGDVVTQNNFPLAVEVTLETAWKDKDQDKFKEMSAIRVIPLRFPNNKEKKVPTDPSNQPPGQVPGQLPSPSGGGP